METLGCIVTFFIMLGVLVGIPCSIAYDNGFGNGRIDGQNYIAKSYIEPCEEKLPRNERCVLVAIPEKDIK